MKRLLLLVYAAVFVWAVYRSVATAITIPEAVMYNHYVSTSTLHILTLPFHPANQVLHSLLCRLVLRLFRVTELSLRIPSLLGLLGYLWRSYSLCCQICRPGLSFTVSALVFAANPFTIGWLPESTGVWMAAALFLSACSLLTLYDGAKQLGNASLLLGLCIGFDFAFLLPVLTAVSLFLHFEFWGNRRITFWVGVNALLLPGALLTFALWILPLFASRNVGISSSDVLRPDWIVLLPGFLTLALPSVVEQRRSWKLCGSLAIALIGASAGLVFLGKVAVLDRFHPGPEAALPKVARALRDDLRRSPPRAIQVSASPELIEAFNFYRRRYALGAVEPVSANTALDTADYLILLDRDRQRLQNFSDTEIFRRQPISVLKRASP